MEEIMAEYPGDATEEDIKNQAIYDLRQQLVGATDDRTVTVVPTLAALLLELLPTIDEADLKKPPKKKMAAPEVAKEEADEDDDEDDEPGSTAAARRSTAAPKHRK